MDEIEVFHYAELITNGIDECLAKKSAESLGIEAGLYKRVFC